MIAFIYSQPDHKYWVHEILMRPNAGDVIVLQDGTMLFVHRVIINFSERIGTHYGIVCNPIQDEENGTGGQVTDFIDDVTDDIFFNRPGLIIDSEAHHQDG